MSDVTIPCTDGYHACVVMNGGTYLTCRFSELQQVGKAVSVIRAYRQKMQIPSELNFSLASPESGTEIEPVIIGCVTSADGSTIPVGQIQIRGIPRDWQDLLAPSVVWQDQLRQKNVAVLVFVTGQDSARIVIPVQLPARWGSQLWLERLFRARPLRLTADSK